MIISGGSYVEGKHFQRDIPNLYSYSHMVSMVCLSAAIRGEGGVPFYENNYLLRNPIAAFSGWSPNNFNEKTAEARRIQ